MSDLTSASREIMWNIHPAWLMYVLFLVALGIFSFGLYQKIQLWKKGKADQERFKDFGKRAFLVIKEILLQNRARGSFFPGVFHSLIFYSFGVLIITTAIVAFDYDFGTSFFNGYVYVFFTVGAELAGLLILVGVAMAAWRRYVSKPETLANSMSDGWALLLIAGMILTGFLTEGLRVAVKGDEWYYLAPIGYAFSMLFKGVSESTGSVIHASLWWTHTVMAMGWIALIPYTKFFHLLALPTNIFFSKLGPRGELRREDIVALMEKAEEAGDDSFSVGVKDARDFSWKQRVDFDACISCGRCEQVCPPYLASQSFSPRKLIQSLKTITEETNLLDAAKNPAAPAPQSVGAMAAEAPEIVGKAFDEEYIWQCRTCTACMEVCPAYIEHCDTVIDIRRNEVIMQGRMPADAARAMKMLESLGNPFGPQSERVDWVKDAGVRVVGPGESCDVIYWIGCCTTFDPTKQKIAKDLYTLLKKCGIEFGVLGSDERCCGDPARLMGQEYLFQTMAKEQVEDIMKRKFKVMLTSCPHCYNVLKNEYPQFGGKFNVVHHTEFLHEMIWSGDIKPVAGKKRKAVYHDPCYLGRYQRIFNSPREALEAVPGLDLIEMKNNRDNSLCCGGGGGHFWMDLKSKKGDRINNLRVKQAKDAGADTIVTSCAYCMQMLTDSVKILNLDEEIEIIDEASIILESLTEK